MSETYLDSILAAHRVAAASDTRALDDLIERARSCSPTRGFTAALGPGFSVIAEVKRRSPSKGDIEIELDPALLARQYERGGASCLSVLTDLDAFGGSRDDLVAARNSVTVPVLRKDFTVSARDVCDARIMGADAVLLIVAALDDAELSDFHTLALELDLDALVEVHDEAELARAERVGARLVGVNQRDLVTFRVDTARAVRMAPKLPDGVVRVAESGIAGPADAAPLFEAGYDAVLVGESLVRSGDPAAAVTALREVGDKAHG
ncbi:MAG TPA: indole-3-glycerol phosphate synthase TrpC [Acidimicrobiales bacterium]|jgi:indole-3-glycerol phosphate synthase|nr:indole-3-glycerol phosphate synthase TrpC [Acidimicrobiales bacterium]